MNEGHGLLARLSADSANKSDTVWPARCSRRRSYAREDQQSMDRNVLNEFPVHPIKILARQEIIFRRN